MTAVVLRAVVQRTVVTERSKHANVEPSVLIIAVCQSVMNVTSLRIAEIRLSASAVNVWSVWMTMAVVMGESVNLVSASLAAMRTQTAHCFQAASLVIANFEAANQTVSGSCLLEAGLQSV